MRVKYALALSGGGLKGAYQVGALNFIREHWEQITGSKELNFDLVSGVSVGALNGVLVAGKQFGELGHLWDLVKLNGGKEIYDSGYIQNEGKIQLNFEQLKKDLLPDFKLNPGIMIRALWSSVKHTFNAQTPGFMGYLLNSIENDFDQNFAHFRSLANLEPLKEKLKGIVDLAKIPNSTIYQCGMVSLDDGLYYALSNQDFENNQDFAAAILASASMPVIWPPVGDIHVPVLIKTIKNAVDGGIRNISPLGDVVDSIRKDDPDVVYKVIIINCNSGYVTPMTTKCNIEDIALRALTEITLAEIFNNDIQEFLKINRLVRQAEAQGGTLNWKNRALSFFDCKIIQPFGNELGDTLDSRPSIMEKRIQLGYRDAQNAFEDKGFI